MYSLQHYTAKGAVPSSLHMIESEEMLSPILHRHVNIARSTPTFVRMVHSDYTTTKLVVLDLDGTLTSMEYMNVLAKFSSYEQELRELTTAAVEGKSNWEANFVKRVELLADTPVTLAKEVANQIPLAIGAEEFVKEIKSKKIDIVIITGAYQDFANLIAQKLKIKEVYSSNFEIKNGLFTGRITQPFLTPEAKAKKLTQILSDKGLSFNECTAIGDSYNDLPMLVRSGQAIIYHAIQKSPLPLTALIPFI